MREATKTICSGLLVPFGLNHKLSRVWGLLTAVYRYNVEEPVMLMKDFKSK